MFFESRDLGPHREAITPRWKPLVSALFGKYRGTTIAYVPHKPVDVMKWLDDLPNKDLLTEVDKEYNESFGGLGSLEGGVKTHEQALMLSHDPTARSGASAGHPIFEFRTLPSSLEHLESHLREMLDTLKRVNETK
jgi:hypothetical protein